MLAPLAGWNYRFAVEVARPRPGSKSRLCQKHIAKANPCALQFLEPRASSKISLSGNSSLPIARQALKFVRVHPEGIIVSPITSRCHQNPVGRLGSGEGIMELSCDHVVGD